MLFTLSSILTAVVVIYKLWCRINRKDIKDDPGYKDGWFGRGENKGEEDTTIRPFNINVEDEVLADLKKRLEATRLTEPVEDSKFFYGFNPNCLRNLVKYWKEEYNWRKQETELNKYPHFLTKIEGIDVHFMHVRPDTEAKKVRVIPLMIIHGWPGCFAEFYKIAPMLTAPSGGRNFVFELICPSIPGYGFSEAPHKKGFNGRASARVFVKLMRRLGHRHFYVQGGDWGSFIATIMARFYPENVTGLHLNMFFIRPDVFDMLKLFGYRLYRMLTRRLRTPGNKRSFKLDWRTLWEEFGYFHMQSTKPDTLGCALTDTPAGLAAYLLEKFPVATNAEYLKREDGGLTEKFTMDELITIVMVYWVTKSFPSAARFYKENWSDRTRYEDYPVEVPSAVAAFPHEGLMLPEVMVTSHLRNLVSYKAMARGGHFAALEEPQLLAEDVWNFVEVVEKRR